ncbi:putative N6-adenosine-methyltransferase MT-A70-like, partial [Capsicum annuum]
MRSFGYSGFGLRDRSRIYISNYEDDLLIMCQVECVDGVKNIEDIAAVERVDCIQMGPLDLSSVSLGYLRDPGNEKVMEVTNAAEKSTLKMKPVDGGAYLSGVAMPHDSRENLVSRGYHMVLGAIDIAMFRKAAVEDVNKFKMSFVKGSDDDDDDNDQK